MNNKKPKVILWAVDPFMRDTRLQRAAGTALRAFVDSDVVVEPVFVLNAAAIPLPMSVPVIEAIGRVENVAPSVIAKMAKELKLPSVAPLKVLADGYPNLESQVEALLQYARERGAGLIVLSTHGKKGVRRWISGSFAETVMLSSTIPLLVVNPHWKGKSDFKRVLFPTDFSAESERAFGEVLERLKENHGTVTIFHHLADLIGPEVAHALEYQPIYQVAADRILADRQSIADRWVARAAKMGVRATAVLDRKTPGSDADAILKYVRRHPALIAMSGRSGKVVSSILGSTTRHVLRGAEVPVWIVHRRDLRREPLFQVTQADIDADLVEHETAPAARASR